MTAANIEGLVAAAKAGDHGAQLQVAELFAANGRSDLGLPWLQQAAQGSASASAKLGLWEIAGKGGKQNPAAGAARILAAAAADDAEGLRLGSIMLAGGVGVARDVERACAMLERAASAGAVAARDQLDLLNGLTPAWWRRPLHPALESEAPYIASIPDFLPPTVCAYIKQRAAPLLQRGKVVDQTGAEAAQDVRTNSVMHFWLGNSDVIVELINLRVADATGVSVENQEGLGVLHYRTGETYGPHVDWMTPDNPDHAAPIAAFGQRTQTLVIGLNIDFEGGETEFPHLKRRFRLPLGGSLHWRNVLPDGSPDPLTLHAGLPPTRGEKWLISKWMHTKAIRPGQPLGSTP
jgi:prolyl 4-hydroxylase